MFKKRGTTPLLFCILKPMEYIDAHSHVQMKEFDRDRDAVLRCMKEEGVGAIVVGVDFESSKQAVELAQKHDFLWATVGLHPHENLAEVFDAEAYRALARHPKVVAIGECGLDYSRITNHESHTTIQKQKEKFKKQIELAVELKKPLMLHIRNAYDDVLEILTPYTLKLAPYKGDVHFFAGTPDIAEQFFALGFTISFTGVITFASQYDEVIKTAPLENILSETDCPFVAPVPYRGKRNEPVYVKEVVKRIAEIRGESEQKIASALVTNTRRVFGM